MNQSRTDRASSSNRLAGGFTLIEVMITVAIVAILAAVALPVYKNYVIRGKLVAGTNGLAALRTTMEQYYQDNRTYQDVTSGSTTISSPCPPSGANATAGTFTLTCPTLTATSYMLKATGSGITAGAVYTVDQQNNMATTGFPTSWGAVPSNSSCWLMRKGDTC